MEQENKAVDIQPISKGKRLLAFLGDFFLTFIITFVIFNALIMPIGNLITKYDERQEKNNSAAITQFNILYGQNVMHHESSEDLFFYNSNVEFTMNCFLSYYSFDDGDVLDAHPKYGHKEENEVIRHFYVDLRNDKEHYLSLFEDFNNEHPYFVISGDIISLKEEAKSNIKLSFFSSQDMSKEGETTLGDLQNLFMNLYADVFKDIEKNDLTYEGLSYLKNKKIVNDLENYLKWQLVISTSLAYLLSVAIYYVILPLFNKDGRTLAMMMMRISRIGTNNLFLLKKVEGLLIGIYMLLFNLSIVFFMPMTYVTFTYLFNIPVLPALALVSVIASLVSIIVLIATPFNQTLSDILSRSVLIKNEDLDEIYRAKGYDV